MDVFRLQIIIYLLRRRCAFSPHVFIAGVTSNRSVSGLSTLIRISASRCSVVRLDRLAVLILFKVEKHRSTTAADMGIVKHTSATIKTLLKSFFL